MMRGPRLYTMVGIGIVFLSAISLIPMEKGFSDNVVNNVSDTITFDAGSSATFKVKIVANKAQDTAGDPVPGCNLSEQSPANVTFTVLPVEGAGGLTITDNPLTFTQCNVFQDVTLTSSVGGSYTINASVEQEPLIGAYHTEPFGTVNVVVVDTTPPETTIDEPTPANPTANQSATFYFSSSEVGSTFECSLDGSGFTTCTSPASYTALSVGSHTFEVRAIDSSGNTDSSPASFTWTIVNPEVTLSVSPITEVWGAPVNASGTANVVDLPSPMLVVDWGDGETTSISASTGSWGPESHSYSSPGTYVIIANLTQEDEIRATSAPVTVEITSRGTTLQVSVPESVTGETKFVANGTLADAYTGRGIDGMTIHFDGNGDGGAQDVVTQGVGFVGDISVESCSVPGDCAEDDIGRDSDSSTNVVLHLNEGGKITFPQSTSKVRIVFQDMGATSFTYSVKEYPDNLLECTDVAGFDCPAESYADSPGEIIVESGSFVNDDGVLVFNGIKEITFNPASPAVTLDVGIAALSTRNEDSKPQELHQINFEDLTLGEKASGFTINTGSYFAYGVAQFDPADNLTLNANFAGTTLYDSSDASATYEVLANIQSSSGVGGNEGSTTTGTTVAKRSVGTDNDKDGLSDTDESLCQTKDAAGTTTWKYTLASYAVADCPTSGTKPDLYYEVDCMAGVTCPTQAELDRWEKAFDDASSGKDINAHFHRSDTNICAAGQTVQAWADGLTGNAANRCDDFKSIKEDWYGTCKVGGTGAECKDANSNFVAGSERSATCKLGNGCALLNAKSQAVRYILIAYNINEHPNVACGTTGKGEIYGNDVIAAIDCIFAGKAATEKQAAIEGTVKHEIGHNLGLDHGGGYGLSGGSQNCKVNHVSVMNYGRQVPTTNMLVQSASTATNVNWYGGYHRGEVRLGSSIGSTSISESSLQDNKLVMTGTWKNRDGTTTITSFKLLWGDPAAGVVNKLKSGTTGLTLDWDGGELAPRNAIDLNYMGVTIGAKQLPACTQTQNQLELLVSPSDELVIMRNNLYKFQLTGAGSTALGLDFGQDEDHFSEADAEVIAAFNSLNNFNWPGVDSPLTNIAFGESGYSTHKKGNTIPVKFDLYDKNNVEVTGDNALSDYNITRINITIALVDSNDVPDSDAYFKPQTSTQLGSADFFTWDGSRWSFQMGTKNLQVNGLYAARIELHFNNGGSIWLDNNADGISFLFKIVK